MKGKHRHTREHRGARVLVTMADGTHFIDVFIERPRHRRWIVLKSAGNVRMCDVKSVAKCPASLSNPSEEQDA